LAWRSWPARDIHTAACHARRTAGAHAHGRTKAEARKQNWPRKFRSQPVERGANVVLLAVAVVMFASAGAHAAKVEPQAWQAHPIERFHRVVNDLVVHGAAASGMGMAYQCGHWRVGLAFIQDSLQPAGLAFQEKCSQCGHPIDCNHL
jgi:hypothetical protein